MANGSLFSHVLGKRQKSRANMARPCSLDSNKVNHMLNSRIAKLWERQELTGPVLPKSP